MSALLGRAPHARANKKQNHVSSDNPTRVAYRVV